MFESTSCFTDLNASRHPPAAEIIVLRRESLMAGRSVTHCCNFVYLFFRNCYVQNKTGCGIRAGDGNKPTNLHFKIHSVPAIMMFSWLL